MPAGMFLPRVGESLLSCCVVAQCVETVFRQAPNTWDQT